MFPGLQRRELIERLIAGRITLDPIGLDIGRAKPAMAVHLDRGQGAAIDQAHDILSGDVQSLGRCLRRQHLVVDHRHLSAFRHELSGARHDVRDGAGSSS